MIREIQFRKDESLDRLASMINVAQFISYAPGSSCLQQYSRVLGYAANHGFNSLIDGVKELLARSPEASVNVRSFSPQNPRSNEFIYGLTTVDEVCNVVRRIANSGLFVIVNETVDVKDGGVSGVVQGGIIEFSPDDTPRCVEKPGVASLPVKSGIDLLQTVYGFRLPLNLGLESRLEFSVHPRPRGWKAGHVLGWELENVDPLMAQATLAWPNNFSRLIGDKAYGLLVAACAGLPVPKTTVIGRRVAPFSFGLPTGCDERWLRTSPKEQVPGKFTTHRGWLDPFEVIAREDPQGSFISSVLAQDGVKPVFSGALVVGANGEVIIEGKPGEGEVFMRGAALPEPLPQYVFQSVRELFERAQTIFGSVRFEWVHDGESAWIVQLHRGGTTSSEGVLVPGEAERWIPFDMRLGLEALRALIQKIGPSEGLLLIGQVGLTSHVADVVRKAAHPARIERTVSSA